MDFSFFPLTLRSFPPLAPFWSHFPKSFLKLSKSFRIEKFLNLKENKDKFTLQTYEAAHLESKYK